MLRLLFGRFWLLVCLLTISSYTASSGSCLKVVLRPILMCHIAVFWAILSGNAFRSLFSTWSNISEHALNSVFAFSEILLPRSEPHPWINMVPLVVLLACYLGLAYVSHATEGFYVYDFLDP